MPPLSNPLRHLWARVQASSDAAPQSIANFDGVSDDYTNARHTRREFPQQQNSGAQVIENGSMSSTGRSYQAETDGHPGQAAMSQQHREQSQQLAGYQNELGQHHGLDLSQPPLLLGSDPQCIEAAQQATIKSPEPGKRDLEAIEHLQSLNNPGGAATASVEDQVEERHVAQECDDCDPFTEFTNEDYHDEDTGTGDNTHHGSNNGSQSATPALTKTPSISSEPETRAATRLPVVAEPAEHVACMTAATHNAAEAPAAAQDQPSTSLAGSSASVNPENSLNISSGPSQIAFPSAYDVNGANAQVSTPILDDPSTAATHHLGTQASAEQYAQDPHGLAINPQATLGNENSQRSPSADSVVTSNNNVLEETAFSPGGMDVETNRQLIAQQWSQRQKFFDRGSLTAEAVQANPMLLHGPMPSRQQQGQHVSTLPTSAFDRQHTISLAPNKLPPNYIQHMSGYQNDANASYHSPGQYPTYPRPVQIRPVNPQAMLPGLLAGGFTPYGTPRGLGDPQDYSTSGLISAQHAPGVMRDEGLEASDDDEPLATRAPRHNPTTGSPVASTNGHPPPTMLEASIDAEMSDEEEEAEPISWKLPSFEATYHPPTKPDEFPMAKVSIPSLVREEVALTEDHAAQEMQLFIDVFLPAQRALQTPDPEPAHAVINFHTISVMVLEAFVQYEIGDEMGRGYGFHSGELARRPSPSPADAEPERTRSAKDADVDEIFFAVIDRWRAALLVDKGTVKLVRGCQEFCDIALDVIHHVKEHGLLAPEPKKRRVRSDKGTTRGPRGAPKGAEGAGAKRKAGASALPKKSTKINEIQPRKKAKVEAPKAKTKPKPKSKTKAGAGKATGVTVTPRKK